MLDVHRVNSTNRLKRVFLHRVCGHDNEIHIVKLNRTDLINNDFNLKVNLLDRKLHVTLKKNNNSNGNSSNNGDGDCNGNGDGNNNSNGYSSSSGRGNNNSNSNNDSNTKNNNNNKNKIKNNSNMLIILHRYSGGGGGVGVFNRLLFSSKELSVYWSILMARFLFNYGQ